MAWQRSAALIITLLGLVALTAAPEPVQAGYDACGVDFRADQTGFGGVEICGIGYPCGVKDGVCPMNFSQGNDAAKTNYTEPYIKYAAPESSSVPDGTTEVYTDGDAACARLGGNCTGILSSENKSNGFASAPNTFCNNQTSTLDDDTYYRAQCDAPRVAGCENCPDPDCNTVIDGYVEDRNSRSVSNATVQLINNNNNNLSLQTETSGDGTFTIPDGVTGYFNVTCGKELYDEQQFKTYVQTGQDTLTCTDLSASGCSADCTAPDEYGQDICVASCDGRNGCSMNESLQATCGGLPAGTERVTDRINDTHVRTVSCCTGPTSVKYKPVYDIQVNESIAGQVDNLEIREYRRELNGTPVTLEVIVYE